MCPWNHQWPWLGGVYLGSQRVSVLLSESNHSPFPLPTRQYSFSVNLPGPPPQTLVFSRGYLPLATLCPLKEGTFRCVQPGCPCICSKAASPSPHCSGLVSHWHWANVIFLPNSGNRVCSDLPSNVKERNGMVRAPPTFFFFFWYLALLCSRLPLERERERKRKKSNHFLFP